MFGLQNKKRTLRPKTCRSVSADVDICLINATMPGVLPSTQGVLLWGEGGNEREENFFEPFFKTLNRANLKMGPIMLYYVILCCVGPRPIFLEHTQKPKLNSKSHLCVELLRVFKGNDIGHFDFFWCFSSGVCVCQWIQSFPPSQSW